MKIVDVAYQLGSKKESSQDLLKDNPDWDIDKIFKKTGILYRHIADKNETSISLAISAIKKFSESTDLKSVQLLIFVSQSHVHTLPGDAYYIHKTFSLGPGCFCLDLTQGCTGFTDALFIVQSMFCTKNISNALIICADTYSKYISKENRACRPIFSDAASAIYIENSTGTFQFSSYINSEASSKLCLIAQEEKRELYMDGSYILFESAKAVKELVDGLLAKSSESIDSIDFFLFHQASAVMLEMLFLRLNIPKEKRLTNLINIGNTVSSSIPILIADFFNVIKDKKIMLISFGVGFTASVCLLDF